MTGRRVSVCLGMLCACCGCVREPALPAEVRDATQWEQLASMQVRVSVQHLGKVPNSGLLLPAVSPDGRWVAYLEITSGPEVYVDSLFSGKGLEGVSLSVREVRRGGAARLVCASGASWPAWSADGKQLAFVAYNRAGRCELGIHDLATGKTRRTAVGLKHLMMPAISPSGRQAALVGSNLPDRWRLHVLDLDTARLEPGPPAKEAQRHLWPFWINDRTLLYLTCQGGEKASGWLSRWAPGSPTPPERVCRLGLSNSELAGLQVFAGLGGPISPNGRRVAYYDGAVDSIVLADLAGGSPPRLESGARAGCWLGDRRFVAATDKDLLLLAPYAGQRKRLMRGAWLPRWGNPQTNRIVVCTRSSQPRTFELVRMELLPLGSGASGR